jgi:hypothetical protein
MADLTPKDPVDKPGLKIEDNAGDHGCLLVSALRESRP